MKLHSNLDLNSNQLLNGLLQNLGSDPGSPTESQIWYNTTAHRPKIRLNGSTFDFTDALTLGGQAGSYYLSRANHTGTQTASTISDFDTQVRTSRLDQMAAPTASVSFNSQKITSLANGTSPSDAATFGQLESVRQGVEYKEAVEAASTANVTISNPGTATFDGVTVSNGEAILLKNQTTGSENGIYVFNGSGSALTRRDDADTFGEIDGGAQVYVQGGSTNGNKIFRQLNELTSFTGQDWQVVGAGTTYTAGSGLTESPAGTFNVGTASTGRIVVNADDIDLASGIVTPGTYDSVTVDTYGRTTAGTNRYTALIGNGSATSFNITQATHGRASNSSNFVQVNKVSNGNVEYPDISVNDSNGTVTLTFAVAPTSNEFRVTIW